jgi:hypothetical protein
MTNKQQSKKAKVHPDLNDFDVSVTEFGEIEGSLDIDEINQFLNNNVEDKKLNGDQVNLPD